MQRSTSRMISRSALMSGAALMIAGLPTAAFAQTPEDDGAESEEIVVTARKREEGVQTVPISIVALTAEDLADRNISNFNDLANATPGVAITSIAGGNVQNIYLRGVAPANTANDLNVEANVGVFIDGIYQTSRNTLDMISVLDVGQIEIAKGPQSALFGRSTFAGALSISTKRPSRTLEGSVSGTVGIDEDYRIRGTISAPLTDSLFVRLGAGYLTYDGYGRNLANRSDNLGGTEKYAVSGALEFAPDDSFSALLSGFFTHSKSELTPEYVLPITAFNCGTNSVSPLASASAASPRPQLFCGTLQARENSDLTPNVKDTTAKTRQVALTLQKSLQGVRMVSVTGYTEAENRAYNDYGGSSAGTVFGVCQGGAGCLAAPTYTRLVNARLISTGIERVRTFSQEIRLQSDNESPFEWLFGGSFFDQRIPIQAGGIGVDRAGLLATERFVAVPPINPAAAGGFPAAAYEFTANTFLVDDATASQVFGSYAKASTQTISIFGALGYRFGNLRVNAEGRYNIDRKRAQVFSTPTNFTGAPGISQPISGTSVPAAGVFPVAGPKFARTFEHFAPRVTVDYQVTPDIFLYASAARGFRSGGFNTANPVSATGILASEVAYEEESNWTYEAGFKSRLLDRNLVFNASVFRVDWSDAQVSAFTDNPTAVNPVRIVQNTGNIRVWGAEAQADYTIADMFTIGGSVNYSDPKFRAGAYDGSTITQCVIGVGAAATAAPGCPPVIVVTTPSGAVRAVPSLEGLRPQRAVKWQWNVHASADVPLSNDWTLKGRVDVSYTGPAFNNLLNTVSFGKRTLTSARLGVSNDRFEVYIWGNNIFDETYVVNSINQPRAGIPFAYSVPEVYLGEGRRAGITATAKF